MLKLWIATSCCSSSEQKTRSKINVLFMSKRNKTLLQFKNFGGTKCLIHQVQDILLMGCV